MRNMSEKTTMELMVLADALDGEVRLAAERELRARDCAKDTEGRWLMPGWESVPIVEPRR